MDLLLSDEKLTAPNVPGDTCWTLGDNLNTVRDIARYNPGTDTTSIVNHRVYDAFGNLTSETAPTVDLIFSFTGRLFDEATGLQINLNRWYDPKTGRFLSEDPVGFAGGDANLQRYVHNNPLNFTDPSGMSGGGDGSGGGDCGNTPTNHVDPSGREKVAIEIAGRLLDVLNRGQPFLDAFGKLVQDWIDYLMTPAVNPQVPAPWPWDSPDQATKSAKGAALVIVGRSLPFAKEQFKKRMGSGGGGQGPRGSGEFPWDLRMRALRNEYLEALNLSALKPVFEGTDRLWDAAKKRLNTVPDLFLPAAQGAGRLWLTLEPGSKLMGKVVEVLHAYWGEVGKCVGVSISKVNLKAGKGQPVVEIEFQLR